MFTFTSPQAIGTKEVLIENFLKVTDGITVRHISQSACDTAKIRHGFNQTGFARASMPKEHDISNSVCCVNFHAIILQYNLFLICSSAYGYILLKDLKFFKLFIQNIQVFYKFIEIWYMNLLFFF